MKPGAHTTDPRRWLTEYTNRDGLYSGPMLMADCEAGAIALLCCVRGPDGEGLRVVGELIAEHDLAVCPSFWRRES